MYIFYHNIVRHLEIDVCKVPDGLNSALAKSVSHRNCLILRNGQNSYLYFIVFYKIFYFIDRTDFHISYLCSEKIGVTIKRSFENKSSSCKIRVSRNCLAEMSGSDNNKAVFLVYSQNLADLVIEITYVISISLLTETTKIIKILPYLRSSNFHDVAQFLG